MLLPEHVVLRDHWDARVFIHPVYFLSVHPSAHSAVLLQQEPAQLDGVSPRQTLVCHMLTLSEPIITSPLAPSPPPLTEYFYNKSQHLNWMMESLSDEIRTGPRPFMANDKAHQLVPIQKFLTAIKNDVRETCEAIKEVGPGCCVGGGRREREGVHVHV